VGFVYFIEYNGSLIGSLIGSIYTINGERFTGLNFCGFEEDHESFSVNILHELIDFTLLANEL